MRYVLIVWLVFVGLVAAQEPIIIPVQIPTYTHYYTQLYPQLQIASQVEDKAPLPIPKAKDMKDLAKKQNEKRIQEQKVWFRNYIIKTISERTDLGYTHISEQAYPSNDKRVYEEFFKELEQAGYKVHLGKERWHITWSD